MLCYGILCYEPRLKLISYITNNNDMFLDNTGVA